MKKILSAVALLFLAAFFFSINIFSVTSSNSENYEIKTEKIWKGKVEIKNNWYVTPTGKLILKPGTELVFYPKSSLYVAGKLEGRGTLIQPIKIYRYNQETQYEIRILSSGEARIRNADISGGGGIFNAWFGMKKSWWQKSYAYIIDRFGALSVSNGGKLDCQNCFFHNNPIAIYLGSIYGEGNSSQVKVNRSSFESNEIDVYSENADGNFNFKYNWWGNKNGPQEKKIKGEIDSSHWRNQKEFKDPVIIIPGILGSWKWTSNSKLKLDPIFRTYHNLYETLKKNGYEPDKNLFTFPYNWRASNIKTTQLLREKIEEIKKKNDGWPKVDLIAHSMGGLVARQYIESESYAGDVDQLVTLGTPHRGAPKDYLVWEGGKINYRTLDIVSMFAEDIFTQEAKENGYDSIYNYIHQAPIQSVKELLPDYDYLKKANGNNELKKYPQSYPRNQFLEKLNSKNNVEKLEAVELDNIIGKTKSNQTINYIKVENKPELAPLWKHGYPQNFDNLTGDHGLEMGSGDGTVPYSSAKGIKSDNLIETNYSHRDLALKTGDTVYHLLTNKTSFSLEKELQVVDPKQMLMIMVFSPVDIQVINPQGKRIGKNFKMGKYYDEIKNAYYTGYNIDTEFITISNPIKGNYKILAQGTDQGDYKIEVDYIEENKNKEIVERTKVFQGDTAIDQTTEHPFLLDDNFGEENDFEINNNNNKTENNQFKKDNQNSKNNSDSDDKNKKSTQSKTKKHFKKKSHSKVLAVVDDHLKNYPEKVISNDIEKQLSEKTESLANSNQKILGEKSKDNNKNILYSNQKRFFNFKSRLLELLLILIILGGAIFVFRKKIFK